MEILIELLTKLIPLYVLIPLGYIAARTLNAHKETLSLLLIYVITPVVVFDGTLTATLDVSNISLPFLTYFICCLLCGLAYIIGSKLWQDSTKNIFAFTAGTGNTGYFGLPVALMMFGNSALSTYVMALFGFMLYENTLGFFVTAKGNHTLQQSFLKVAKLPTMYAFFIGIVLNILGIQLGDSYQAIAVSFRGTYTILGMMIIGIALAGLRGGSFDTRFMSATFATKFLVWPIVMLAIIWLDTTYFHIFTELAQQVLLLLSIVPLAANTVAFASALNAQPGKASLAVLWSTIFALIYIPLFVTFFF